MMRVPGKAFYYKLPANATIHDGNVISVRHFHCAQYEVEFVKPLCTNDTQHSPCIKRTSFDTLKFAEVFVGEGLFFGHITS